MSEENKYGPSYLLKNTKALHTRMGAAFPGTRAVFRGHDLHKELLGFDWIKLYAYGICGRKLKTKQIKMLNALWVSTSYPDARLWNNRVSSLAATVRSTPTLGIAASLAVSEATVYGGQASVRVFEFLTRMAREVEKGAVLAELVSSELKIRRVYGYGRPINSHDERIPWLMEIAEGLGLQNGRHVRLAFEVQDLLVSHRPQLMMNFAGLYAAFLADMGFSQRQYQLYRIPTLLAGMPPCFLEAWDKTEGSTFPLDHDVIDYQGVQARAW